MPLCLLGHNSDSRGIQYTEVWIQKIQGGDRSRDQGFEGQKSVYSNNFKIWFLVPHVYHIHVHVDAKFTYMPIIKKKNEKDCYISKDIVATVLGVSNECWSVHTNRTRAPADGNHSTPGKNACPEFVSARYTVQYIISIRKMLHMYLVMYVRHLCLYFISHCLALITCVTNGQGTIR